MEPLYAKLYDKYAGLKAKRLNELDAAQKDQEVKFAKCIAAAEELIQHLRKENDGLRHRVEEFTTSSRSFEVVPSVDYQKLLAEEIEKNRKLSEDVERLQRLQQVGASSNPDSEGSNRGKAGIPGAQDSTDRGTRGRSNKKRRRSSGNDMDGKGDITVSRLEKDSREEVASLDAREDAKMPDCRVRAEDIIGYSFALTCLRSNNEAELMYEMHSLGTLERIAPEWMREVIKFSINMFPVFIQRIANITKISAFR